MGTSADWTTLRVTAINDEAEDVRSYVLVDPAGASLPAWEPGAHIDLKLDSATGTGSDTGRAAGTSSAAELIRQYSLCGSPEHRDRYQIAVLRADNGRGGSRFLHQRVRTGDELAVRGPRNNFPLADAPSYLFVAGGIGITPLLPMLRAVHERGADWRLYYGGRRRTRMAFLPSLGDYGERVHVLPEDEHGLLPLADILGAAEPDTAVHCCGPEPLLAAAERAWSGRPADRLRTERFHARADLATGVDVAFEVLVSSTGQTVPVAAEQSIMDALGAAGVEVPSSCREGTCATCETTVLAGEIEHRDSVLTESERAAGKTMMLCVSRARTPRLVLDL